MRIISTAGADQRAPRIAHMMPPSAAWSVFAFVAPDILIVSEQTHDITGKLVGCWRNLPSRVTKRDLPAIRRRFDAQGIQFLGGEPNPNDLLAFIKSVDPDLNRGEWKPLFGRFWRDVAIPGIGIRSGISFWESVQVLTTQPELVKRTVSILGLEGQVYVEAIDSSVHRYFKGCFYKPSEIPSEQIGRMD